MVELYIEYPAGGNGLQIRPVGFPAAASPDHLYSTGCRSIVRIAARLGLLLAVSLFAGCASDIPAEIRNRPEPDPTVAEVRADPESHEGFFVRWGGEVVSAQNLASETRVKIVSRPLLGDGYPVADNHSDGRFIAVIEGFVDPVLLPEGHRITIHGRLSGSIAEPIGEYSYEFPLVQAGTWRLWEPRVASPYRYPRPYPRYGYWPWYDPWLDPWYRPYRW
jgi:outer membrane lipoprotein